MSELQSRLHRLRGRIRYAVWLHGVSWMVVALLGAVLFIGFVDWRLHVDDASARLFLGLTVLIGAAVLAWRTLVQPLRERFSDVAIALKIERRYPGFHDSLASSVEFSEQDANPRLGSPELQRRVIDETMQRLQSVNVDDVVETRGVRRAAWIAVGVCLLVAAVAGWKPAEASLALQRLMFPFSAGEWPREHQLVLLERSLGPLAATGEPFRRVQGDTFKFYVADKRGRLPDDVTLLLRHGDGESRTEKLRRVSVRDATGVLRELCVANILVERGPITFRVVGGDDHTMPYRTLHVVPAPRLESLKVRLHPPKYSRRPVNELPDGVGHFEALVGTRVVINARANKPLQSTHLRVKNRTLPGLKLSKDGRQLNAEFTVTESGNYSYWFEFKDREGFENPQAPRYDVKALADRVPVVRLAAPSEDIRITAGDKARGLPAVVTVKPLVEDDLGIRTVALRYRREDDEKGKFRSEILFRNEQPAVATAKRDTAENRREYNQPYRWELKDVTEGMQIRFYIEAADDFDLDATGRPAPTPLPRHVGRSLTRTISIVTPAEKTAEIAGKYGQLLEDLVRAEKLQRRAHEQVGQLRVQLQKTKRLRPNEDLSLLNRVIQDQTDVSQQLVDADSSVLRRAGRALEELRANHLANPKLQRRLGRIVAELEALRLRHLRNIVDELRAVDSSSQTVGPALKNGKPPTADPAAQLARLKTAETRQAEVLKSLGELIGELSEWRNWQDLSGEVKDLFRAQQDVQREAEQIKRRTLGLPAAELTPQQRADLARLAERQRRIGDRIGRLQKQIGKFLQRLRKEPDANKPAIETLWDVDRFLRDQDLTERMRKAGGKIEANELGEMSKTQKQLVDDLRELEAILENRGTDDLETLIKRQQETEAELRKLEKRQQDVQERLRKLGTGPKTAEQRDELQRLIKEQQSLRKQAAEIARKLRRLSANRANDATQQAADGMDRALQSLRRGALPQAGVEQKDTLDRLEQARRELARARQKLQATLAAETLQRMADDILGLIGRQTNVIGETSRLKTEFERTKKWTRGRRITLDTTRDEQDRLRARVAELAKSSEGSPIFSLALKRIAAEMEAAVKALARAGGDPKQFDAALTHEAEAKRVLVQLVDSLRPDNRGSTQPPPGAADGGQNAAQQVAGPSHVAQLKLLKSLQDELKDRTAELDGKHKAGTPLTAEQKQAIEDLASRQEKLADLVRDFMRDVGIPAESDPAVSHPEPPAEKKPQLKTDAKSSQKESASPVELLRGAHRKMRIAGQSLGRHDTGAATRKTQQQISDDLDKLIRSARRQSVDGGRRSSQASQNKGPPPNDNGTKTNGSKKRPGSGDARSKSPTAKGSKKKPAGSDSEVRGADAAAAKAAIARQERLIQEVWGHLPDSVKQKLRNVSADRYLPTYKSLIRHYFESLAE